ncbi:hypothetical protein BDM02DRAFT_3120943 [Thelephora ganbajun]|uniref:Uncharacterized protein n=1 Tax=Thelephora ganbajun TaxID=370292 RepID=A0ACB6Z661_THEGA|nr:hypothetical protein BDM02DRAFT_3120943 [Thelephora ganbajun]
MSVLVSHLSELPIETLEQIFLYLPGQDIIKMEAVRCLDSTPYGRVLTLRLCDLGQSTLSGCFSRFPCPSVPTEPSSLLARVTTFMSLAICLSEEKHTRSMCASGPMEGGR